MHYAILGVGAIILLFVMSKQIQAESFIPISEIERKIFLYAKANGIEPAIVMAVVRTESNFNPNAKNPSDPSFGLMQITDELAYDYGLISSWVGFPDSSEIILMMNIDNNLDVGCGFLSSLLSKYSFDQAIQSYNVGERGYFLGRRNPDYLKKVRTAYEYYK